tara:strand:+ start:2264 stop:2518 length:255 start_codon:yes stop_codon:yes gene_type:complete
MSIYTQYTGTFTKKNGSERTMSFIKATDLPSHMISNDGKSSATATSTSTQVVYDTQANGFRSFNYGTQVGQLTERQVQWSFDKK